MESWMTMNPPDTHTHVHDHGHHEITGVYYYETNRKDGNLFFLSPTGGMGGNYLFRNAAGRWDHTPKVGKLILFPGYLGHGVKTNETDHTRKAIAFSVTLHRKELEAKIRIRQPDNSKKR
jgi:ectoine hydroxylase-related dioxygenase (phytanoyl-CoA dioxygenase family)